MGHLDRDKTNELLDMILPPASERARNLLLDRLEECILPGLSLTAEEAAWVGEALEYYSDQQVYPEQQLKFERLGERLQTASLAN